MYILYSNGCIVTSFTPSQMIFLCEVLTIKENFCLQLRLFPIAQFVQTFNIVIVMLSCIHIWNFSSIPSIFQKLWPNHFVDNKIKTLLATAHISICTTFGDLHYSDCYVILYPHMKFQLNIFNISKVMAKSFHWRQKKNIACNCAYFQLHNLRKPSL